MLLGLGGEGSFSGAQMEDRAGHEKDEINMNIK
jgi:hypothetical protein